MFIKRSYFWSLLVLCFLFGFVFASVYETMDNHASKRTRRLRTSDIVKQIDMSEEQRTQLNHVLENGRKRFIELNKSIRPEISKIRQDTRSQIREILTDAQRAKFDNLVAQNDKGRDTGKSSSGSKK